MCYLTVTVYNRLKLKSSSYSNSGMFNTHVGISQCSHRLKLRAETNDLHIQRNVEDSMKTSF